MSKTPFLLAASAASAMAAATPALADDGRAPFDGMTEQAISQIITYAGYDAVDIDLKGRMLQQLGGRHHPPLVVQEVGDEPVSERRQGDGHALERHAHLARVETERPGLEERATMAGGAPDEGAHPGQQLLHVEGLRQIAVGAGVDISTI